jgi:ABC-2 type transport system permease protein
MGRLRRAELPKLLHAEWLKLRTIWMGPIMLGGTVGYTILQVVATILSAGRAQGTFGLGTVAGVRVVLASATRGFVFIAVLGILAMAGEFRHQTATGTFLAAPRRGWAVTAKLLLYTLVGLAFAAVATALTLAIALPWLAARQVHVPGLGHEVLLTVAGLLLSGALYGLLGVGVGALLRNQVAAVVIAVLWITLVDALLVGLAPVVGRWTPGGALAALTRAPVLRGATGYLPPWAGGLLLAAYGIAFAVAGTRLVVRRDVT